jgi:hypothetical protein
LYRLFFFGRIRDPVLGTNLWQKKIQAKNEIHVVDVVVVVDVVAVHVAVVEAHKETSQIFIMTKARA